MLLLLLIFLSSSFVLLQLHIKCKTRREMVKLCSLLCFDFANFLQPTSYSCISKRPLCMVRHRATWENYVTSYNNHDISPLGASNFDRIELVGSKTSVNLASQFFKSMLLVPILTFWCGMSQKEAGQSRGSEGIKFHDNVWKRRRSKSQIILLQ